MMILMKNTINKLAFPFIKILRNNREFRFNDKNIKYFIHESSWNSERVIEIPIIMDFIKNESRKLCLKYCDYTQLEYCSTFKRSTCNKYFGILEFGNVLDQFVPHQYDILDKYSEGKNVIHQDIVDFNPKEKYDLIVSISTLEHVGFNEDVENIGHNIDDNIEKDKTKIAMKNIIDNCLKPNGKMIFSVCLGYNKDMDELLFSNELFFTKLYFLKRISKDNRWIEVKLNKDSLKHVMYGKPYNNANYICIGIYENNTKT